MAKPPKETAATDKDETARLLAAEEAAKKKPSKSATRKAAKKAEEEEDDDEDEDDEKEEDDEEISPHTVSATETRNALKIMGNFLWPFFPAHKKGIRLILVAVLVETIYNTSFPLLLKFLIDDAINADDPYMLVVILGTMFGLGVVSSIVMVWFEWLNADTGSSMIRDIRNRLFDHSQALPVDYYHKNKTGAVLQRFSGDIAQLEETINHGMQWGVLPLFELVAGVGMMFFLNWQLAMVALFLFPIAIIGPRILAPRAVDASYEVKKNEAAALGVTQEVITSMGVVKAFGLQGKATGWYRARNDNIRGSMFRMLWINGLVERSVTISVLALHLFVLALGAYLVWNETIQLGTFVAFETLFWELSYNVGHITQFIPVMIEGSGAAKHINDYLDEPIRSRDNPDAIDLPRFEKTISFDKVTFSYDGKQNHLNGLNLSIEAGQRVAIVGRSGAGKSTIINTLLKLYDIKKGIISLDGIDISTVKRDSVRQQMAVVFQDNLLFNMSIMENVRLGNDNSTDEEVIAACKAAEIHKFIMGLPDGYQTLVGERGSTVSGGQRQRLAIARAVVRNPSILLLDEATSALDQTTERAISRTLNKVAKGRTVISVTHRLTSVVDMDKIYVLEKGKLAESGTHTELLAKKGFYFRLWQDQLGKTRADDEDDED
ncbi:MAG: ABC transporter ATP-binding protein [Beijerinckiaceae bacterium]